MNKLIFTALLLASYLTLPSQNFFPTDSAVWKEAHSRIGGPNNAPFMGRIIIYGDTIINGMHYKFLDISYTNGKHLIRLDSTEQKVFLQPQGQGVGALPVGDNLFYDFGVTVGDSIPIIEIGRRDTLYWVVIKDSVQEFDGKMLRFIDVYRDYYGIAQVDRWVEGIGSLTGFLAPFDEPSGYFEFWYQLVCFQDFSEGYQYESDFLWFDYMNCNASLSVGDHDAARTPFALEAYPNPFGKELKLENPSNRVIHYSIITSTGQEIKKSSLAPLEYITINTELLSKGVYLLRVSDRNQLKTKIILKK
jgi:hypothetical protein